MSLPLSYEVLDAASLAHFVRPGSSSAHVASSELGPLLEWWWLRSSGIRLGDLTLTSEFSRLRVAFRERRMNWTASDSLHAGLARTNRAHDDVLNPSWTIFCRAFEAAAIGAGLAVNVAKHMTAAMREMEDNIHWHSERTRSGIVAYWVHDHMFEFVVLDRGIGVLRSLCKASEFAALHDHGTALRLAVSDGNSRFGSGSDQGFGFHNLFLGIANHSARIRFRSGDHVLIYDGTVAGECVPLLAQRSLGGGFMIGVQCVVH